MWANPDGTLQAEVASGPVRFKNAQGTWTPVDLALVAAVDGSVSSRAHPVGLRLSGAQGVDGDHDLVSLGQGSGGLTLGWSGRLPTPVLDGTMATYVDALPGVDLVVEATRTGFESSLVVKDRVALARVASVSMRLSTARSVVADHAAGGLTLKGGPGQPDIRLPEPAMWDAAVSPNSGDHLRVGRVAMSTAARPGGGMDLQLVPDAAFLADPALQFPVTIDPSATVGTTFSTFVETGWTSDQSGSTDLKLGYADDGGSFTARSFMRWNTAPFWDAQITSATLYLWEYHSWSCTLAQWEVWLTGWADTSTRWTNQPAWQTPAGTSTQTKGYSSACNDGWVSAPATGVFQAGASNHWSETTMGIRATSETNHLSWKRFNSRNAASNIPYAVVTFNSVPSVMSQSTTPSTQCTIGSGRPYLNTTTPKLSAQAVDPEGSPVTATFEWWTTGGSLIGSTTTGSQASGSTFTVTVPSGAFSNGGTYSWRVRGSDGTSTGPYGSWCEFTVDTVAPGSAPAVSSAALPYDTWTGAPPSYRLTTATQSYVSGTTTLSLTGDDAEQQVALPFAVSFFGKPYSTVWVDTDGMVLFADPGGPVLPSACGTLPDPAVPAGMLLPFCEDFTVDTLASVRTATIGAAPNRQFVIDWNNVLRWHPTIVERVNFEVLLGENGTITYNYSSLDNADEQGASAVVGLEDGSGSQGVLYSQDMPSLANNTALVFTPAQSYTTGYTATAATRTYTPASTVTGITGDDAYGALTLPFPVSFYGNSYRQVWVDTNGQLDFVNPHISHADAVPIPDPADPNGTVDVFADDLWLDASSSIRTATTGTAPNRQFTIEWNNVGFFRDTSKRFSAEVILPESGGDIIVDYTGIDPNADERGGNALVGIESPGGALATQYAYHQTILATNTAVTFHPTTTTPLPLVTAGTPVSFTFTASGISDVASYLYGLDVNPPVTSVNAPSLGANATVTITPDSDGVHTLYVRSVDRAGNTSAITSYIIDVGLGGLSSPKPGDISAGKTPLQVATSPVTYGVTYQWRRGDVDTWTTIPATDVTIAAGGGPVTWPLARVSGAFPKLTWALDTTLNNAEAGPDPLDGPLQVRALFTGGLGGASTPVKLTFDRNQASAASTDVGPGSVNLLTGNYALGGTDVSVASYGSDLTVTRSFNTRRASATDGANMFGPGWVSGVVVSDANAPYTQLTVTGSLVQIGTADGDPLGFTEKTVSGSGKTYDSETGFEQIALTYTTAGDFFTLKDLDGNTVTFTRVTGSAGGVYNPTAVTTPGSNRTTSLSWQKVTVGGTDVIRPTQMLAPVPAGVSCATLVRGCRALTFSYATATTATGTEPAQWGDYLGRVTQIAFTAWDPDATPAAMRTIVMARYSYDSTGRLRSEYDPRLDWTDTSTTPPTLRHLATTYDYDADGIITTISPGGGFEPWQLSYTTIPGDPGKGRLAQVSRSALTAGTARTTVVYKVPLSGSGAPYDLSATQTARWGQGEQPVDATAIYDPGQIPDGNQAAGTMPSSYERASMTYIDSNGRTVNTVAPGGYTTATWYDMFGNTVRELTAGNLKRTLDASPSDTAAQEAAIAARESTVNTYSPDGLELRDTVGPEHDIVLANGTLVRGRTHTVNTYDQGAPGGGPFHLVTTTTTTVQYTGSSGVLADADAHTTTTGYDWTLQEPTINTVDPSGLALATRTSYDPATGLVTSITTPAGGITTNTPATRQAVYYRAGTGSGYAACDSHAEWASLPCRVQPGGQAASGPELPVTVTTYDIYQNPRVVVDQTSAGVLRTLTVTYNNAGRAYTTAVTGAAGTGTAVPNNRIIYDQASGLAVRTQSLDGSNNVSAQIVRQYDTLSRVTSYTDADANTSTTTYDLLSRPATIYDGQATRTYIYDGGNERRGMATQVNDEQAASISATYDANGDAASQTWTNGVTVTLQANEEGHPTSITYTKPGCGQPDCTLYTQTVHESAVGQWREGASTLSSQRYSYDNAGRLTNVYDTVNSACTVRAYGFNAATDRTSLTTYAPATDGSCQTATVSSTTIWAYDTADRVNTSGYVYDSLGRTATTPAADVANPGSGNLTASYYVTDMIRSLSQGGRTTTYDQDVVGSRIRNIVDSDGSSSVTKTHHYLTDNDSPAWTNEGTGDVTRPIVGLTGLVAVFSNLTGLTWQLTDLRGNIVAGMINGSTGIVSTNDYTEYGMPRNSVDIGSRRYGWLGGDQRASDTPGGATLMGARIYVPGTGRFLSTDPIYGGSANSYDYCSGDAVNCSDVTGTFSCRIDRISKNSNWFRQQITVRWSCRFSHNETRFIMKAATIVVRIWALIVGVLLGALIGFWIGGLIGAIVGAIVGGIIVIVLEELFDFDFLYGFCTRQAGVTIHGRVIFFRLRRLSGAWGGWYWYYQWGWPPITCN